MTLPEVDKGVVCSHEVSGCSGHPYPPWIAPLWNHWYMVCMYMSVLPPKEVKTLWGRRGFPSSGGVLLFPTPWTGPARGRAACSWSFLMTRSHQENTKRLGQTLNGWAFLWEFWSARKDPFAGTALSVGQSIAHRPQKTNRWEFP